MSLIGLEDNKRNEEKLIFWDDIYGVQLILEHCVIFAILFWANYCIFYLIYVYYNSSRCQNVFHEAFCTV